MKKRINYYIKLWLLMSRNSFASVVVNKGSLAIFLFGKIVRFTLFFVFLFFLLQGTDSLAGYTLPQTIFFFLTFNLIDVISQFLFREVYRFRPQVVSGQFDLTLTKPSSALFRSLVGGADFIDLITIPPLVIATILVGRTLDPSVMGVFMYILLIINGLLVAGSFHIIVLSIGIITLEVDYLIMIYRDLVNLGRFPIEIYREPIKGILTYLVPVAIMVALPAKVIFSLTSPWSVVSGIILGVIMLVLALQFWKFALTRYTSASS